MNNTDNIKKIFEEYRLFFDDEFSDNEKLVDPIFDIDVDNSKKNKNKLLLNKDLDIFLKKINCDKDVFFTSVFAYTISRFTFSDKSNFIKLSKNLDKKRYFPVCIDCGNDSIKNFVLKCNKQLQKFSQYCDCPVNLLKEKFNLSTNTGFMYDKNFSFNNNYLLDNSIFELLFIINDKYIFGFSKNKYSEQTINRILLTFEKILNEFLVKEKLIDINYSLEKDIDIVNSINATEEKLKYNDILEAFNDSLKKYPDNILVSCNDIKCTYKQAAIWVNNLEEKLEDTPEGSNIAIFTHRSHYYVLAALSVLNHNCAYVPIDDTYPDERIKFMLKDSNSKSILVTDKTYNRIKNLTKISIVNISDINTNNTFKPLKNCTKNADSAVVLYTSGTTGNPKGTLIKRHALLNLGLWYINKSKLCKNDVIAMYSSFGFDAHLHVFFSSILIGASVNIIPDENRKDINKLCEHIKLNNISHILLPTALFKLLDDQTIPKCVKVIFTGGEALGRYEHKGKYRLFDAYGPTEGTEISSIIKVSDKTNYSSIGHLVPNVKAYILDKEQRRVPYGAIGELYLSGYQLAKGYLNRDKEDKASFFNNPFDNNILGFQTMYKTGDIVRFLPDRTIGFVGRIDSQVKIRGNRVELGEVEAVISEISEVNDVTVQVVKNNRSAELVAYVVSDDKEIKNKVIEYVSKRKPGYMVPSFVILLDKIPLNANDKIDKQLLPKINLTENKTTYFPPTNIIEKSICNAFEKVFNLSKVGIDDDFLALGGDSIKAIQLVSLMKEYQLLSADITNLKTPKLIAKQVVKNSNLSLNLNKYDITNGIPLSEQQLNIYLDIVINGKSDTYLIPFQMKLGEYLVDSIKGALIKLINKHPILKAYIKKSDIPCLQLGNIPTIKILKKTSTSTIKKFIDKNFDISKEMCRFLICEDNKILYAVFHHLIFDGMSISVFYYNLLKLLKKENIDEDLKFIEASAFSKKIKNSLLYKEAEDFYKQEFEDNEQISELLPSIGSNASSCQSIDLDIDINNINNFCREHKITKNVLFTCVFAYTLSRFTNSINSYFTMIENGRDRFDASKSIGMFVNTLPLLIDCNNDTVENFIKKCKDKIYKTVKYNFFPYRVLNKIYNLFNNIQFQYFPNSYIKDVKVFEKEQRIDLICDLLFEVHEDNNKLTLNITSNKKYSNDYIYKILCTYERILNQILIKKSLRDIEYSLIEDINRIKKINSTEKKFKYYDILEAFNDSLEKYPNNTIVNFIGTKYTYKQAAKWIHNLNKCFKNIPKGNNIAVLTNRNHYYLLAALGILNHGCAYVPIDDAYPDERIKFMLQDSNSVAVLIEDETYDRVRKITKIPLINVSDIDTEGKPCKLSINSDKHEDAVILYTSGSTGIPKGTVIPKIAICNLASFCSSNIKMKPGEVFGLYASYGFDSHIKSLYTPIMVGGSVDIFPRDILLDINKIDKHIEKYHVDHLFITTQVAKLFIQNIKRSHLKFLFVGGEKLGDIPHDTSYSVMDAYGPTEACVFIGLTNAKTKIVPESIGYPNSNNKFYVLDKEQRQVPFGAIGELYISGYQLAKCYLNKEDINKKIFVSNPFDNNKPGYEIMYKTGDVVRYLPDGTIGFLGRIDNQVKIRGNRVELGEVEAIIRSIKNIKDVTVQTITNNNNKELVAYVVCKDKNIKDYIIEYVSKYKPLYMVPTHVVVLDEIPLNTNGKVNKKALPKIDIDINTIDYVAPTNNIEKIVCNAFEQVFNMDKVGINDDFTLLGGDSIKSIRLITILGLKQLEIEANQILSLRTPKAICETLVKKEIVYYEAIKNEIDFLPIQKYFFDQAENKNSFNQFYAVECKEIIDKDRLQNALNKLTNIQDQLRASYINNNQFILPEKTKIVKLKSIFTNDEIYSAISKEILKSINSLNLKDDHLIDIKLINNKYITFVIHHLIIDGVSWSILLNNLADIYNNKEVFRPYPYASYIKDVYKYSEKINKNSIKKYKTINNIVKETEICGKPLAFSYKFKSMYNSNNPYELNENEYLLLAVSRAYKKIYGKDIVLEMESHGRDETIANVNHTIGWFTTIYPILINVSSNDTHIDIIKDLWNVKISYLNNKHLGLDYLAACYLSKKIKFKHSPVVFNFLSDEFSYSNDLFSTVSIDDDEQILSNTINSKTNIFGISLNIKKHNSYYLISGFCPKDTYLFTKYKEFLDCINNEMCFISNAIEKNEFVYPLTEEQLSIYLDENVNNKDTAYSCFDCVKINKKITSKEATKQIEYLLNSHKVLKTRILSFSGIQYGITDASPNIEIIKEDISKIKYCDLIKPFNFDKSLARFYIIINKDNTYIAYDMHHMISDATSRILIKKFLHEDINDASDFGFLKKVNQGLKDYYSSKFDAAKLYYEKYFADFQDITEPIEDINNNYGGLASIYIENIKDKVCKKAQELSITPNAILASAFAYTLSRFTNSDFVYFTFTNHGRDINGIDKSLGMYVKTMPLFVNTSNQSVHTFLSNFSKNILNAMQYSIYPFRLLAKNYHINQNITFEYNKDLNDVTNLSKEINYIKDEKKYKFHVSHLLAAINDKKNGYIFSIEHSYKYSKDTIIRFLKVYQNVLMGLLNNKYLKNIQYTLSQDIKLINKINQTEMPLKYKDILEAFNESCKKYPNNIYVSYLNIKYTYKKANKFVNKLSKKLSLYHQKDFIAVFTERCQYYPIAALAVLNVGASYVPIDDKFPDKRVSFMISDANCKAIIVSNKTIDRVKHTKDLNIINIDDVKIDQNDSVSDLNTNFNKNDVAVVLYTSGTTGQPKGSLITRGSILNLSITYINDVNFSENDVYSMYTVPTFDMHALCYYPCMFVGASFDIVPEENRYDLNKLNEHFSKTKSTHTYLTTPVGKLFLSSIDKTNLKVLFIGGDFLGKVNPIKNLDTHNIYGPTESLSHIVHIPISKQIHSSSIGHLISNIKVYILDKEHRRVPFGAMGELYISGYQLCNGYLNRENENNERFFNNPFDGEKPGYEKIYKTGDIVRYLSDFSIGIIGRVDTQVKIRGNRVELGEIESEIRKIDFVKDVVVLALDFNGNKELCAYVAVHKNSIDNKQIKSIINHQIENSKPSFMVPAYIEVIEKIPLNINGKVNKRALPLPDLNQSKSKYVAPRNKFEKEIVYAFENVFKKDKVGIDDSFIQFGGDSLSAIKILSILKYTNLNATTILNLQTPRKIACCLEEECIDNFKNYFSQNSYIDLTNVQKNVYLDQKFHKSSTTYRISFDFDSTISKLSKVNDVLNKLFELHPILSMKVVIYKGKPCYVYAKKPKLIHVNNSNDVNYFVDLNLDKGPLCKIYTYYKGSTIYVSVIVHHVIFDGRSRDIFIDHFFKIYKDESIKKDLYFLKDASKNKYYEENNLFSKSRKLYENMFSDIDSVPNLLPIENGYNGYVKKKLIIKFSLINSFIKRYNILDSVLFNSVFALTLACFTNSDYAVFTITENGRDNVDAYNSIGMYVKSIPIILKCNYKKLSTFIKNAQNKLLSIRNTPTLPFSYFNKKYGVSNSIMFQYLSDLISLDINEETFKNSNIIKSKEVENKVSDDQKIADLECYLLKDNDNLYILAEHSDKYNNEYVASFLNVYNKILQQIVNNVEIEDLIYISKEDQELFDEVNNTNKKLKYNNVLEAFDYSVKKYPNNIALKCKNIKYTYKQLDKITNGIAAKIKENGIKNGDLIAVIEDTNEFLLINSLAILKCGCAYVPINSKYPYNWIKSVIKQTNVSMIVTSLCIKSKYIKDHYKIINSKKIELIDKQQMSKIDNCQAFCIIATSGTTGKSKLVELNHVAVSNLCQWQIKFLDLNSNDKFAMYQNYSFVSHIEAMFSSMFVGACVVIVPEEIRLDLFELEKYFKDQQVTIIKWGVSIGKQFLNYTKNNKIRKMMLSGERLGSINNNTQIKIIDAYGPTETTAQTCMIYTENKLIEESVGFPIYNTKIYVLDNNLKRKPLYAAGCLYASGICLANRYLNYSNKKAFIKNPFSSDTDYSRIYNIGDVVRFLSDGSIGFIGRKDSQVKIRGNRVELSEVENIIEKLSFVNKAIVTTITNKDQDELVAYIKLNTNINFDLVEVCNKISDFISSNKPSYMVPSFIKILDKIPLNVNGKVNKQALEKIKINDYKTRYVAPSNDIERDFCSAYEDIFSLKKVGVNDDFITLGGDSLTAIKLISKLKKYQLTAVDITKLKTPKLISKKILNRQNFYIDFNKFNINTGAPLSEQQLNIYFDALLNKEKTYLISLKMHLDDYVVNDIYSSLIKLMEVHPVLTCYIDNSLEIPYIRKGKQTKIKVVDKLNNRKLNTFLSSKFNIENNLSRFLIDRQSKTLYAVFHHLIFDGFSILVFKNHLLDILRNKKVSVDIGYLRSCAFSDEIINSNLYKKATIFFEQEFIDGDNINEFLSDVSVNKNAFYKLILRTDKNSIEKFKFKYKISDNILYTSVFAYTLSRFINSDKSYFSILENGRDRIDAGNSIGMFVNTLPIIIDCHNDSVLNFINKSADRIYKTIEYSFYKFKELKTFYNLKTDIIFQYRPEYNNDYININKKVYEEELNDNSNLVCDLSFIATNNSISVSASNKYSSKTIKRFLYTYEKILSEILTRDNLKDINYCLNEDIKIIKKINLTEYKFRQIDIAQAFNYSLSKYPESILVSYQDIKLTYKDTAIWINNLTKILKNIPKQSNIAILTHRSQYYLLCALSVLNCECVYVPLETSFPDDRIKFICKDSDVSAILATDETFNRINKLVDIPIINVSNIKLCGTFKPLVEYNNQNLNALILYTSGTTGEPKGTIISRKAILNIAYWYSNKMKLCNEDVCSLYTSFVFDMHVISFYPPLFVGATIDIVPESIRLNMQKLNLHFKAMKTTHTFLTTSIAKMFTTSNKKYYVENILVAGEKLGEFKTPKNINMYDGYGPTESLAIVTLSNIKHKLHPSSVGSLGFNIKAYILDKELRQVPFGATGELYLSGYQLAKGYLNRDKENKEAFFYNPFDGNKHGYEIIYKTGDLVRYLPDNTLGFVGRNDSQVKIRGNRVELSEIESSIRKIKEIKDVTVQIIINKNNDKELAAYVVSDIIDIKGKIIDHISKEKPSYMIPAYVIVLNKIKRNINGKVEKKLLPKIDTSLKNDNYEAPANKIQQSVCYAFEEVFGLNQISINDDFNNLGGDSIKAIRLVNVLNKKSFSIEPSQILSLRTPKAISYCINKEKENIYKHINGYIGLLPIQKYYLDKKEYEKSYSQSYVVKSNIPLDLELLQKAVNKLTNIQDQLRACFKNKKQYILPINTKIVNVKSIDSKKNINKTIEDELYKSFEVIDYKNNLIDIKLINNRYLTFVIHHLIIDGISWSILLDNLAELYNNRKLNRPYPYAYYIDDIKRYSKDITNETIEKYKNINNLIDENEIKGHPIYFTYNFKSKYISDNSYELTENDYLLLAVSRAYKKIYNKDIILGMESYGRDESVARLNQTIGWFTTIFPQLINVNKSNLNIDVIRDLYTIKNTTFGVKHLGIDYLAICYILKKINFKYTPVTFNFLSDEFSYSNSLFKTYKFEKNKKVEISKINNDKTCYGISLNISKHSNIYSISGYCATSTYLENKYLKFLDAIQEETQNISRVISDNVYIYPLHEDQLGIYLDEKMNHKGTAYSCFGYVKLGQKISDMNAKRKIELLLDKHPVLKSRIVTSHNEVYCATNANIDIDIIYNSINKINFINLIKPFMLDKSLSRFFIIQNPKFTCIAYDMHHLICDASSRKLINEELRKKTITKDDFGFLKKVNIDLSNKNSNKMNDAKLFFEKEFSDIDIVEPIADVNNQFGGVASLQIKNIKENVLTLANKLSITPNNILTCAFAYTLSRFVNSNNTYFVFTSHGRDTNTLDKSIGMFVRTIPIILNTANKKIDTYLKESSKHILDTMKHSIYSFRLLYRKYQLSKNIAFEYNSDLNGMINTNIDFTYKQDDTSNKFHISDLLAIVNDYKNGYVFNIEHSSKYSKSMVVRFLKIYEKILRGLLKETSLNDIDYTLKEDVKLFNKINRTEFQFKHADIMDAYNESLKKYPDNILVKYLDVEYSYKQGAKWINNLVEKLKDIPQKSNIAILVNRSHYYLLTALGVLAKGCAYIPIDDAFPDKRIKFMLKDGNAKVILVTDETHDRVKTLTKIPIINVSKITTKAGHTTIKFYANSKDAGIILYTSGTTGIPKGTIIPRCAIINLASYYVNKTKMLNKDIYSMYTVPTFDMHVLAYYPHLLSGATLNIVPENIRYDLKKLYEHLIACKTTHITLPTKVAEMLLKEYPNFSIKTLLVGGDKLGKISVPKYITMYDGYGPTESLAFISCANVKDKICSESIGKLNDNTKVYILDKEQRLVPYGAIGELYISGYQLANGYLNRDKENKEAFFDNPFEGDKPGYEKMYKTGDVVRYLQDETLGFIGRIDSQVKIRGNRVELGEVEATIRQIKEVKDVTVQISINKNNKELVVYVVSDKSNIENIIMNYIKENKPSFMVPSYVVVLDKIPLNINGKIDKRLLPKINIKKRKVVYEAPKSNIEKILCESFEKVFNVDRIGINDDFLALGGDSIKAIRLVSILNSHGLTIEANQLLVLSSVKSISKAIIFKKREVFEPVVGETELLPIQKFFFDQIPNKDSFSQSYIVKSNKIINPERLQHAFNKLSSIQDELRACFINEKQILLKEKETITEIKCINFSNITKNKINEELNKSIELLNLKNNHLIDIKLINGEYILFVVHHLLIDGVSWSILLDNLAYLYNNKQIERPYPYALYAEKIFNLSKNISNKTIEKYNEIHNLVKEEEIKGYSLNYSFKFASVFNANNSYELSENDFLFLAVSRAYKKTYEKDIIFHMESHGRDDSIAPVDNTIGWFTTIYPMVVDISGKNSHFDIISDMHTIKQLWLSNNHLNFNYLTACYYTDKINYKHMPISFNYLGDEFAYSNDLFTTINLEASDTCQQDKLDKLKTVWGLSLNIYKKKNEYFISGSCAHKTYLEEKYKEFLNNIKNESLIINKALNNKVYVYPLHEEALNVYLDEKIYKKDTAYNCMSLKKLNKSLDVQTIKNTINNIIVNHPCLKTRIYETEKSIYGITDAKVPIKVISKDIDSIDFESLNDKFNINKGLACFYIILDSEYTYVLQNIHHIISDAITASVINKELTLSEEATKDFGFIKRFYDEYIVKNSIQYKDNIKYFDAMLKNNNVTCVPVVNKTNLYGGIASIYLDNKEQRLKDYAKKLSVTENHILTSIFALVLSYFTSSSDPYFVFTNHGRDDGVYNDSVGMYAKTIPFIADTSVVSTEEFVKETSKKILNLMKLNVCPFRYFKNKYHLNQNITFEYNYKLNSKTNVPKKVYYKQDKIIKKAHISDLFAVINDYRKGYVFSIDYTYKFDKLTVITFLKAYKVVFNKLLDGYNINEIYKFLDLDSQMHKIKINLRHLYKYINRQTYCNDTVFNNSVYYKQKESVKGILEIKDQIIDIFSKILNHDIGKYDMNTDLNSLGLDSFAAVLISNMYKNKYKIDVSALDILKKHTIYQQVDIVLRYL